MWSLLSDMAWRQKRQGILLQAGVEEAIVGPSTVGQKVFLLWPLPITLPPIASFTFRRDP